MMYNEFIKGTGCKDNEYNRRVYKNLGILYMNSDMTKEEIYEYGKKLVDNSKTEAEIALEKEIKASIALLEKDAKAYSEMAERNKQFAEDGDSIWKKYYKDEARRYANRAKECKDKIRLLKGLV